MRTHRKHHVKQAGGNILHTADNVVDTNRFMAYIDGKLLPLPGVSKPVLISVKGRLAPFDPNLEAYHFACSQVRRVK